MQQVYRARCLHHRASYFDFYFSLQVLDPSSSIVLIQSPPSLRVPPSACVTLSCLNHSLPPSLSFCLSICILFSAPGFINYSRLSRGPPDRRTITGSFRGRRGTSVHVARAHAQLRQSVFSESFPVKKEPDDVRLAHVSLLKCL